MKVLNLGYKETTKDYTNMKKKSENYAGLKHTHFCSQFSQNVLVCFHA